MAGFLFQPHRALLHLATSPRRSVVGLETLDDITVLYPQGATLLEQAKLSSSQRPPLGDTSRNLWRSLQNWKSAVEQGYVNLDRAAFHLVTNSVLSNGILHELRDAPPGSAARRALLLTLREAGKKVTGDIRKMASDVLAWSDDELLALVQRVVVIDGTESGTPTELRQRVFQHLAMPSRHEDEIYEGLLGWIDSAALRMALEGTPIWFTREAFENQYRRLLFRYDDVTRVRETAEQLMAVTDKERQDRRGRLFVFQLHWTGLTDDDEQILEAIDAHIRSGTETTRLSREGTVSADDFRAFDDRLITRWKLLARKHHASVGRSSEDDGARAGQELLTETLLHREMLAGQATSEYYLTQGAYHRLADDPPALGWHPNYKDKLQLWRHVERDDEADS